MEKENVNPTNVTQDVSVEYEEVKDTSLTHLKKSIAGVKGALVQTNERVKTLANENRKLQGVISELQEKVGTLIGKLECIAYKVNQPWYKRLFK